MDEELQQIVEKMVASGEPEENIALVIQHYKPKTNQWDSVGQSVEAVGGPVAKGIYDLGRTAYSGLVDATPQNVAQSQEAVKSILQPTNVKEFIKKDKILPFQKFVRDRDPQYSGVGGFFTPFDEDAAIEKYGKQFMESQGLGAKVDEMEKNLPKVIERRKALEGYVQQQKQEAGEKLQGVVQDYKDVHGVDDSASYIGGLAGQAVYQIPLSAATKGASSYLMESATIYDKQLDYLADKYHLTREEVIDKNLDEPAKGQAFAILAGAMDAGSAGNIIGAFRSGGGAMLKKYLKSTIPEALTEAGQGVAEDLGAGYNLQQAVVEHAGERVNEAIGGFVGGHIGAFDFSGKTKEKEIANKMIAETADTGNPDLNSTIDAEAALTPAEEETLKTKQAEQKLEEVTKQEDKLQKEHDKENEQGVRSNLGEGEKTVKNKSDEDASSQEAEASRVLQAQKVEATQKLKDLTLALADPATTPEQEQELYRQLSETKQALRQLAPEKPSAKKTEIKTRIEDTTGVTKPDKSIQMTPAEAIKHQVQTFYRGVEEGVYKGKNLSNDLVSKVQGAIKDSPLTSQQVSTILTKVRKTNLFTPGSISKLNDFIDKASANAEYAQNVNDAIAEQTQVKKKSKTKVAIPVNYKEVAKQFAKIDPSSVEDVNEYRKVAGEILGGFKDPKKPGYKPVDEAKVQKYIDTETDRQDREQMDRLKEQFGFEEFSDEDVNKVLNSPNLDEEDFYTKRDEINKKASRDKILRVANYSQIGLEGTNAPQDLKDINLERLSDGQLVEYVRTADNIIQNDDYSNAAHIEAIAKAVNAVEEIKSKITKNRGEIGRIKSAVYNVPMLFDAIYSDSKSASTVQNYSGIADVYNGGSIVEGQEHKLYEDFSDKAKEIKKKYGTSPLNADTQVRIGLFAPLVRYPKGADPNATLAKSKKIVESSINRLMTKKSRQDLAKDAQRLYQPFRNAKTIDEVVSIMKRIDPGGYEMWQFFNKKFEGDVKDRLKQTSEELYNQPFVEEENYTPKAMETVDSGQGELDDSASSAFHSELPGAPKQAHTAKTATNSLANGRALNFEFYNTMFKKYRESLYDIETSKPRLLFREFMRLPETAEILGGQENKNAIIDTYKKSEEIQRGVGRDYSDASKLIDEITGTLRTLGYTSALGSADQFVKQYIPVATNTIINLGGDSGLFFARISKEADKLFNMYTIGQRGRRLGGAERGESTQYKVQSQYRNKFLKAVNSVHKLTEKGSHIFMFSLTKGDVSVAKRSWAAYYLKYLKDNGVDLKTVDLGTENELQGDKLRKEAAAYAEHKVKTTQVVSNPSELGKLLRTSPGPSTWIKNIFIPFSTFSVNTKARVVENLRQLRTAENKPEAYRALAGTVSEIALYSSIKYFILSQLYGLLKGGIEDLFDLEPPEEKDSDFKIKQWYSAIYKDFMPFAIGTGGESASVEMANALSYISQHPDATYEEWKKETGGGTFYQYKNKNEGFDMGLYSVGLERVQQMIKDISTTTHLAKGDPAFVSTPWGEKELDLNSDQEKFVYFMTGMDALSGLGLMDAAVYNQVRKIYKEQLKGTNDKSGTTSPAKPLPRPANRPQPRPLPLPR